MSKVNCPCGDQLSDVASPSACKALLLSEAAVDNCGYDAMALEDSGETVWRCTTCGRLAIEEGGTSRGLHWYAPEAARTPHPTHPIDDRRRSTIDLHHRCTAEHGIGEHRQRCNFLIRHAGWHLDVFDVSWPEEEGAEIP